ncbi:MAG: UDP-N-acetylglucosamine 1-carboxyvinyltransferase [Rhabdochlamydiaceae bacterium]|nr:UDP-N-acetylglucosamine 1-carboxyvinyltransferase [Rhabdochlamydiaceae bacterium]
MEILKIKGGVPLEGRVKAAGAKNAITKILVASLISDKRCTLYNVPNIAEVEVTVELCREIGSEIVWDKKEGVLEIVTKDLKALYIPQRFSGSNRIPILMIGALLGRTDEDIIVPTAGGCKIGKRPVDLHIDALEKLGAVIEYRTMKKEGAYFARAHQGLKGTLIHLNYPSVGATENCILAAVRAKGTTVIKNAAMEPEIFDLILFLQKLGAHICVDVDRTIRIEESTQFYDVEHTVITDRIEVASLGMAAISTKGKVFVEGAQHHSLITFLNKLREVNGGFNVKSDGIEFFYKGPLQGGVHIETDVYPGFATDWQQPFVVLLTQAQGFSTIHETVYENRFGYTETLNQMGARIELFTHCLGGKCCRYASQGHYHSLIVQGPTPLTAKEIVIPDLRAGFAYVMAGLLSQEETIISGLPYLDRGYENLTGKLQALGANVTRQLKDGSKAKEKTTQLLQVQNTPAAS